MRTLLSSHRFTLLIATLLVSLSLAAALVLPNLVKAQQAPPAKDTGNLKSTKTAIKEVEKYKQDLKATETQGTPTIGALNKTTLDSTASWFLTSVNGNSQVAAGDDTVQTAGVVGTISNFIEDMMSTPPARTDVYVADLLNNMSIATPAYAQGQGLGFAALTPILETWKTFRNIAYIFFVVIFLAIGFMIMFRSKIGGQTAITAQQAIPNIILSLVFVTFSYAIAGLLIDAMYIVMYLLLGVFGKTEGQFITSSIFLFLPKLIFESFDGTREAVAAFVGVHLQALTGSVESFVPSQAADNPIYSGIGILFGVIIAMAVLFSIFRLFFELLKTYINILFSITLAPLVLMLGALPGRKAFEEWIKGLIGNLAAFPIVLFILILFDEMTGKLSGIERAVSDVNGGFSPPYLFGVQSVGIINFVIGLGMLMILPDLVIQGKKALGATGGIFEQFGQALADATKKGWSGGELIPGLGFTNTNTMLGLDRIGGVSAGNIIKKTAVGAGGLVGGIGGAIYNPVVTERFDKGSVLRGIGQGASSGAKLSARVVADKHLEKWANNDSKNEDDKKLEDLRPPT